MKTNSLLLTLCLMLFAFVTVTAQSPATVEFKVTGNCNMCKKTIESSLKGKKGVQSAVWNKDTKMMKVTYNPSEISEDQIHQAIADSGYDTEKKKASDKAYHNLPECCQYKRTLHTKSHTK